MNTVWDLEPKPGGGFKTFLKTRLLALSMVLVIGFLLLISLVLSAATAAMNDALGKAIPMNEMLFQGASLIISIGVVTVLFAMIFKVLPDADVQWRDVWSGAFMTACLFSLGKMLLALYLGREETASAYGAAGALILLLSWVYYSITSSCLERSYRGYARRRGRRIQPTEDAVRAD